MKKILLRALAVVPILLLVTSFANADSAMQLVFNGGAPTAGTIIFGCGASNACSESFLVGGLNLVVSVDTGNGGGSLINLISSASGPITGIPIGSTIEIDYAVNNFTKSGASGFTHAFGGTLYGADTADNNILFNGSNTLGFTGSLIDHLSVGSGGATFLASSANDTGNYNFNPSPFTMVDQTIIHVNTALDTTSLLQETSAFAIPEPASLMLLGGGFLGLANILRRKLAK